MPELIDRDALLKKCIEGDGNDKFTEGYNFAVQEISAYITLAPTIGAEPVRHGRWMLNSDENVVCSQCRHPRQIGAKDFCGKCGADMREEGADNG